MRIEGHSIGAIASRCGIAKSSVSRLVRDLPLTDNQITALADRRRLAHASWSRQCRANRRCAQLAGRAYAELNDADYAAGVMLYWAEGSKSRNVVALTNSDACMLRFFADWLQRWYPVDREQIKLDVNCFLGNGPELAEIEDWWLSALKIPRESLRKSIVNRPSSASKRAHRTLVYGTARISVGSTFIVQSIYGAIQEIGGFDRPEWLDLGAAMADDVPSGGRSGEAVGG
jgi:hypothetical protein